MGPAEMVMKVISHSLKAVAAASTWRYSRGANLSAVEGDAALPRVTENEKENEDSSEGCSFGSRRRWYYDQRREDGQ